MAATKLDGDEGIGTRLDRMEPEPDRTDGSGPGPGGNRTGPGLDGSDRMRTGPDPDWIGWVTVKTD